MRYQTVAQVRDAAIARIVRVALRAHGFHPLEPREGGLPGMPNLFGPEGVGIDVPENEMTDAGLLVRDLLKDMEGAAPLSHNDDR